MDRIFGSDTDDNGWEVCNDNGFVYKRRRRRRRSSHEEPTPADAEAELRRLQLSRKRRCLLTIREKYKREIEHWEALSTSLLRISASPASTSDTSAAGAATHSLATPLPSPPQLLTADDLLAQVEYQEAALRKLSDFCDCVDSFYEAQEELVKQSLFDLPVWGSPRTLMRSLSS